MTPELAAALARSSEELAQMDAINKGAAGCIDKPQAVSLSVPTGTCHLDLASSGGHHVPGTGYEWRHGYIPLTLEVAKHNKKGAHLVPKGGHDRSKARVAIRPGSHDGQSGHHIVGTDAHGRRVRAFAPGDRSNAAKAVENIKAGRPAFEHNLVPSHEGKPREPLDWTDNGKDSHRARGPKGETIAVSPVRTPVDPEWKSKTAFGARQIAGGWKTSHYHWSVVGQFGSASGSGDAPTLEQAKAAAEAASAPKPKRSRKVNLSVPVVSTTDGAQITVSVGQHMAALRKLAAAHKRAGPTQRPKLRAAMATHAKAIQKARKA